MNFFLVTVTEKHKMMNLTEEFSQHTQLDSAKQVDLLYKSPPYSEMKKKGGCRNEDHMEVNL